MRESGRRQVLVSLSLSVFGYIDIAALGLPWLKGSYRLPGKIYEKTLNRNEGVITTYLMYITIIVHKYIHDVNTKRDALL